MLMSSKNKEASMTGVKAMVRVGFPATAESYRLRNCSQLQMNVKASPAAAVGSVSPSVKWNLYKSVTWANVSGDWRAYARGRCGCYHGTVIRLYAADSECHILQRLGGAGRGSTGW